MTNPFVQNKAHTAMMDKATATPVFAEITRHRVPTRTRGLWMPRTDGLHPGQVR